MQFACMRSNREWPRTGSCEADVSTRWKQSRPALGNGLISGMLLQDVLDHDCRLSVVQQFLEHVLGPCTGSRMTPSAGPVHVMAA